MEKGYLQIYTGNGKGKTTAALGLAIRAAGAGMRVLFAQFLKSRSYSEHTALERFNDCIEVRCFGTGEWVRDLAPPDQIRMVREGIQELTGLLKSEKYDLVVLDEAVVAVALGLMTQEELLHLAQSRSPGCEMVLTGRDVPQLLLDMADLVTEMVAVRHYFDTGVTARRGIEF